MDGVLTIAVPFSAIGGMMAALDIYLDLRHHLDDHTAARQALKAGLTTFVCLVALSVVAAYFMQVITW